MIYPILPCAKPRMTQSDRWKQRPAVMRYRAFADRCRALRVELPEAGAHIIFHLPIPESWSRKKKEAMRGKPHRQRPDTSNLVKALEDAVYADDSCIWDFRATKLWADTGAIQILPGAGYLQQAEEAGLNG